MHANHVLKCRGNLFLDGGANIDDVDIICYDNVEVSSYGIVLDRQGYTLPGNFTAKKARPLITHLGHTYNARNCSAALITMVVSTWRATPTNPNESATIESI